MIEKIEMIQILTLILAGVISCILLVRLFQRNRSKIPLIKDIADPFNIKITNKLNKEQIEIELSRIDMNDAKEFYTIISNNEPYISKYMPIDIKSVEDEKKYITMINNELYDLNESIAFKIKNKTNGKDEIIGSIGLNDINWKTKHVSMGYFIIPEMQRKGIITNCVKKLEQIAFGYLKLEHISLVVCEEHIKSQNIAKRLDYNLMNQNPDDMMTIMLNNEKHKLLIFVKSIKNPKYTPLEARA